MKMQRNRANVRRHVFVSFTPGILCSLSCKKKKGNGRKEKKKKEPSA